MDRTVAFGTDPVYVVSGLRCRAMLCRWQACMTARLTAHSVIIMSRGKHGMNAHNPASSHRLGIALVTASAVTWSFGGTIARFLSVEDSWTVVFWRALFGFLFLLGFLLVRDGPRKTVNLFAGMGLPGLAVAFGFAVASTCFILAISYTTVANVILIQASVPLLAALMVWLIFREKVAASTWAAIAAVIVGVGVMVSGSLGQGNSSWIGNALALTIAIVFAMTTVVTRRFPDTRMTPACAIGCLAACLVAATQAGEFAVSARDMALLVVFGALNLGLGMAFFVTGARLVPSALAALLGTLETVLSPLWVAVVHGEIPDRMTVVGGVFVLAALFFYLAMEFNRQKVPSRG